MNEERLLTVREVARACNRSEETVRRWIWSGKLPARKLGNQLFIAATDVPGAEVASTTPRVAEAAVEYRVNTGIPLSHPLSDGRGSYDREKARAWLRDAVALGRKIGEKYGPFDAAEAVRQSREEH